MRYAFLFSLVIFFTIDSHASKYDEALNAFDKKEYSTSIVILKTLLQQDSQNIPARVLLSKAYLRSGEFEKAEFTAFDVINNGADKTQLLLTLAEALLYQKKYEQALSLISDENMLAIFPYRGLIIQSQIFLKIGQYNQAISGFNQVTSKDEFHREGTFGIVAADIAKGDIESAKDRLKLVEKQYSEDTHFNELMGEIAYRSKAFDIANSHLNKSIQIDPNNARARLLLVQVQTAISEYELAIDNILKVLEVYPNSPNANLLYAQLLVKSGKIDDGQVVAGKLSEVIGSIDGDILSNYPSLRYVLGASLYTQEQWESAYNHLTFYAESNPLEESSHLMAANIDMKLGRYQSAQDILNQFTGSTKSEEFWLLQVATDLSLSDTKKALSNIEEASAQYPNSNALTEMKSKVYLANDKIAEALDILTQLHEKEGLTKDSVYLFAQLKMGAKQLSSAKIIANKLLNQDQNNPSYLSLSSGIDFQSGDFRSAISKMTKAISIAPEYVTLYLNLSRIYEASGDYQSAINTLFKAHRVDEKNVLVVERLGDFNFKLKNYEQSLKWRQKLWDLRSQDLYSAMRLSDVLLEQGKLNEAVKLLINYRVEHRLNIELLARLGMAYTYSRQCDNAKPILSLLGGLVENSAKRLARVSELLVDCLANEQAHRVLSKAEAVDHKDLTVNLARARWLMKVDQSVLALELLDQIKQPDNFRVLKLRIDILEASGELVKAFDWSKKLLSKHPYPITLRKAVGLAKQLNRPDEAIEMLVSYTKEKQNRDISLLLAKEHYLQKNHKESEKILLALVDKYNDLEAHRMLSLIYQDNDIAKAIEHSSYAFNMESKSAKYAMTYGWQLQKANQLEEAIRILRQAYALDSRQPTLMYRLAAVLALANKEQQAVGYLREAVKYDFPDKADAKTLLNKLTSK